jgi:orotate phosphoribosyltransferase
VSHPAEADPRARLLCLLREHAVLHGDFLLSSGQRSSYYLDARIVTLSAQGSALVGEILLDSLAGAEIDAVAGLTLGADPIVCAIAVVSARRDKPLDGLIVRKHVKGHGSGKRIEGPWRPGLRVAIVDDTLTTGASSLEAANAVEEQGGAAVGVWALIDREQGAGDAIRRAGYPFHAIFRARELLD